MRNKVLKKLLMIAMAVTMISGTSIATVYANANPPAEETTTQVVEETATESTEDTEKKEDTGRVTGEGDNSAFSTPGNAQLVDDKENDDTKQFLTIQTKKGNTFYMVIDRSSNTENVYMMSLVDENDLAEFLDETEKSKETEESTVVIPETTPETTPVAEEETGVKKEEKTGMNVKGLGAIVLAAILGVAGIAVYKKHGRGKEDDYVSEQLEFSDGPYVNEEEDEEEEEEPRSTFSFFKKKEPEVEEESSNSKISQPFDNTITASREAKKRRFTSTGSKVVSMNGRGVEVYVIKPQDFAEAQTAADLLKEGRTVVINLEGVELTVAQRSIDFVGGATYAINGSLQAVSNNIFIAAPDSIEVSGDLKSEIMNENTISPQLK